MLQTWIVGCPTHITASVHNWQIIDDRYNRKPLIMCSQLPVADWYNVFQCELIADACLDRIVHKAIRINLQGESLRKSINFAVEVNFHEDLVNGYHRNG